MRIALASREVVHNLIISALLQQAPVPSSPKNIPVLEITVPDDNDNELKHESSKLSLLSSRDKPPSPCHTPPLSPKETFSEAIKTKQEPLKLSSLDLDILHSESNGPLVAEISSSLGIPFGLYDATWCPDTKNYELVILKPMDGEVSAQRAREIKASEIPKVDPEEKQGSSEELVKSKCRRERRRNRKVKVKQEKAESVAKEERTPTTPSKFSQPRKVPTAKSFIRKNELNDEKETWADKLLIGPSFQRSYRINIGNSFAVAILENEFSLWQGSSRRRDFARVFVWYCLIKRLIHERKGK